jgi:hypothetical protein
MPLTWRRIALLAAALAAFVLLLAVPVVRTFYALQLPHRAIGSTLLIAALGAAALAGFWVVSRPQRRGQPRRPATELNRSAKPWPQHLPLARCRSER